MTDLAEPLSTTIDEGPSPAAGGGGQVDVAEPASLRADLETVFRENEGEGEKGKAEEAKPEKPEPKAEDDKTAEGDDKSKQGGEKPADELKDKPAQQRDDGGKFAKGEEKKEGRRFVEAPQSFMPNAKELWRNTPHAVQAEVDRLVKEQETEREQSRASVERYESLRQYDEIARGNGRDLRESLERMTQVENLLQQNPIAGLNAILMEVGPRKADGQPFSLQEVAQFIVQQEPAKYQQMVAPPAQQQPHREDPRIAQQQEQMHKLIRETVIAPFAAAHPRYEELAPTIEKFLNSGMIPDSLSPVERLEHAYDMAERVSPPSRVEQVDEQRRGPANDRRADEGFSGSQSIKSSPGSVVEDYEPVAKAGESTRDSLRAELRKLNRA